MKKIYLFFKKHIDQLVKNLNERLGFGRHYKLNMMSSSISFYLIWIMIPFGYLLLEIVKVINFKGFDDFVLTMFDYLPESLATSLNDYINSNAFSETYINVFFIITLVFSMSKISRIILTSSELVYTKKIVREPVLEYILGIVVTIMFVLLFILIVLSYIFITFMINYINNLIVSVDFRLLLNVIEYIYLPVVLFLLLTLIYSITNPKSKKVKSNYKGALLASLSMMIVTSLYYNYVEYFARGVIYTAFSGIMVFIVWLYTICYCFVVGLSFNAFLLNKKVEEL